MTRKQKPPKTPNQNDNINKRMLCKVIGGKLVECKYNIEYNDIYSVMHILFDELIQHLKKGTTFNINNFGTFSLRKMPSRKHFNFQTRKIETSKGNKILRFDLDKKLRLKLLAELDIDKTFKKYQ